MTPIHALKHTYGPNNNLDPSAALPSPIGAARESTLQGHIFHYYINSLLPVSHLQDNHEVGPGQPVILPDSPVRVYSLPLTHGLMQNIWIFITRPYGLRDSVGALDPRCSDILYRMY